MLTRHLSEPRKILERVADYIFWDGEACNLETNLIVLHAEKAVDKYQYFYQSLQLRVSPKAP
ncbi:hypothetical protein BDV38DRAFT_249070 [Aspergillus pseudotamarii]|uniref:Uncharacterized protein n=1 Tax=Aspergillus pseudotamarii TaxID=132259 RepID=A0A5N6SSC5_ASPPS|nr:uncharacterized protein BDV38DRAFT_249070 [Aspergillus pseudotamarii]KAE8136749.1 hypothetical protein BDV38DRAFT_249070 [Aspergillus pseudotamarii]